MEEVSWDGEGSERRLSRGFSACIDFEEVCGGDVGVTITTFELSYKGKSDNPLYFTESSKAS